MNYCDFNIEPFCSDVCGDRWRPQTLAKICRNMGICYGFRAVAARGKYPGFILFVITINANANFKCHPNVAKKALTRAACSKCSLWVGTKLVMQKFSVLPLAKPRSRGIWVQNYPIALKFDRRLDSSRVMWGKTPTLRIHAHILITNGWNSLKLIYNQIRLKFLTYRYFRCEICDIIEIKRLYKFYSKMGVLPHMWAKRPPFGAKRPPRHIALLE